MRREKILPDVSVPSWRQSEYVNRGSYSLGYFKWARWHCAGPCRLWSRGSGACIMLSVKLALLGFPTQLAPNEQLFVRSNGRLLEDVLHFMFTSWLPEESGRAFADCWPVVTSLGGKRFRAQVMRLSEELARDGRLPRPCVPRKSCLDESAGGRLVEYLEQLADHVLDQRFGHLRGRAPQLEALAAIGREQYAFEASLAGSHLSTLHGLVGSLHGLCRTSFPLSCSGNTGPPLAVPSAEEGADFARAWTGL